MLKNEFNPRLAKLSLLNEQLVNLIPDSFESKGMLVNWLKVNPYSPYVTLYGGVGAKNFDSKSSFISPTDNKERFLLEDKISFKLENFISFDDKILSANTKLSNVINSSELFKNYPTFKDIEININISNSNNNYYSGNTLHSNNEANKINIYADSNENAMRVLLHELQHCIQLKEGFKIGASYYNEDGVMELFVGSNVDTDGNYKDGSFSDISTKATMVEIGDGEARIDLAYLKPFDYMQKLKKRVIIEENGKQVYKNVVPSENKEKYDKLNLFIGGKRPLLEQVLSHSNLYEIYPSARELEVNVCQLKDFTASYGKGVISLNREFIHNSSEEEIISALLHEIQHNIQEIETWAMGGNNSDFKEIKEASLGIKKALDKLDDEIGFNDWWLDRPELLKQMMNESPKNLVDFDKLREMFGREILSPEQYQKWMDKRNEGSDIRKSNLELYGLAPNTDLIGFSDLENYRRLWGEQQARAVQLRMNMSEDERLKESWTETLEKVEGRYDEPIIRYSSEISLNLENAPKIDNILKNIEDNIRKNSFETLIILDNKGFVISEIKGDENIVKPTKEELFTISSFVGEKIMTHNHPLGASFSWNDITFALQNGIDKIRAVSHSKELGDIVYELKGIQKLSNTEDKIREIAGAWKELHDSRYDYFKPKALANDRKKFNTIHMAHTHKTIVDLAKTYKLDYTRIRNKNNIQNDTLSKEDREKNFKEWFGDSKVVDANGEPLVVYHGTKGDFSEFRKDKIGSAVKADNHGFFFTSDFNLAERYASLDYREDGNIMPVYINSNNPLIIKSNIIGTSDFNTNKDKYVKKAIKNSNDSIIIKDKFNDTLVVAFNPSQIKSIHNKGTFDINNPNILEKNDYGLRQIEMMLSIVPDKMEMSKVKEYLLFNGISHEHLRGSMYQTILDTDRFDISRMNLENKVVDMNNTYFNSFGEIESRKIEDIYISKIDSIDINELFGSHHSTQDISWAMSEIEKSDKKVEQRLG